jgi:heme-degrading monooxygenase HmoA
MPKIAPEDHYLTVINMFSTDTMEKQDQLLGSMREIVNTAAFPGWISSTVHSGQDKWGTLNFIQWRSKDDLELRYAGEQFKHHTIPLFTELTTSFKLLQNEVVYTRRHPSQGDATLISPGRDDYTVVEFFGVTPQEQGDLVELLGPSSQQWLLEAPGYRSHSVLRGLGAKYFDDAFAIRYSQWDDKESYDNFRSVPESEQSPARQKSEAQVNSLAKSAEWNSYRIVQTRSADDGVA